MEKSIGSDLVASLGGYEWIPSPPSALMQVAGLSLEEKRVLVQYLQDLKQSQTGLRAPKVLREINEKHYHIKPVDPLTFFTDKEYLGHVGNYMFPLLLDRVVRILNNSKIREVVLTGAIGYGKSFIARAGMAYEIYRMLCMKEPMTLFGNQPGTQIVFSVLSVTGDQALDGVFADVRDALMESPIFQTNTLFRYRRKEGHLWFQGQNLLFKAGTSSENSIIGENVIGAALDEANFLISAKQTKRSKIAGELDQAVVLYNALERRRTSRFLLENGSVLARIWLISSKQFPGDFTDQRARELKGKDYGAILDYPQWLPRMTGARNPYGKRRFFVFLGNAASPSRVLGEVDTDDGISREALLKLNTNIPVGCKIQAVPYDAFWAKYRQDVYGSIRDISGWAILAKNPLLDPPEIYRGCVCLEDCGDIPREHPFIEPELTGISLSYIRKSAFPTQLIHNETGEVFDPSRRDHHQLASKFHTAPKLNPHRPRIVHIDIGRTKDGAAIAMGHFGGYKQVITREIVDNDMVQFIEERPITIIDWMIRFYAPAGGKLEAADLRRVVLACYEFGAYPGIEIITFDQFQSNDSVDAFQAMGFESHNKAGVDRNDDAYLTLRQSLIDRRTSYYEMEPLFLDLSSLEHDTVAGKVDHTGVRDDGKPGTKDIADCIAAIHAHVAEMYTVRRQPMVMVPGDMLDDFDVEEMVQKDLQRALKGEAHTQQDRGWDPMNSFLGDY